MNMIYHILLKILKIKNILILYIIEQENNDANAHKYSNTPSHENKRISELIYLNKIIKTILKAYEEFPCYKNYANI